MGKWKCLWCSKVLEGESFIDLVAASMKEEEGQHVHGWENVTPVELKAAAVVKNKLLPVWSPPNLLRFYFNFIIHTTFPDFLLYLCRTKIFRPIVPEIKTDR
jgi:hypothetical protein